MENREKKNNHAEQQNAKEEDHKTAQSASENQEKNSQQDTQQKSAQQIQEEKIKELTNHLQRLQAEFENYKKRLYKDQAAFVKLANENLIKELLPLLDHFQLAFKQTAKEDKNNVFMKGMELIYGEFYATLEKQGLKKISCEGKFNPHLHEALLQEPSDKEKETILEELQSGYFIGEKVIRPAKVKISAGNKEK